MAFSLVMDVTGTKTVSADLLRFGENARNLRPMFAAMADEFYLIETEQFDTRGHGRWRPLTPAWVRYKATHGYDTRILHMTLALRNALTGRFARGRVRRITATEAWFGTNLKSRRGFPYPKAHQRPLRSRLPRRPPIELTHDDRRRLVKVAQRHLLGRLRVAA